MRYFLLIFVVCVAAVIGIAGKRGTHLAQDAASTFSRT